MAVEARHSNIFPPQLIPNRNLVNINQGNSYAYNRQMMCSSGAPFHRAMPETVLPLNQSLVCDNADSGLTYNIAAPRKRSRDSMDHYLSNLIVPQKNNLHQISSFLGQDISIQIQQQQLEIDTIITQHTKKIRLEVEERQNQQARLLASTIREGVVKKLKEKEEYIERMGKLNLALQEKVKSMWVENQLWRDLAQTSEATAISLRSDLEQVLAHVSDERLSGGGGRVAVVDEAESCCGSSDYGRDREEEVGERRTLAAGVERCDGDMCRKWMCRKCGDRESCVLLLPCRHLCLCTICGSTLLNTCPVCNSNTDATVHVSMS